MSFQTNLTHIDALFSQRRKYIVPRYQRKYIWGVNEWTDLFEDIFIFFKDKKHFLGSIVLENLNNSQDFNIVDGQQRLTTILVILCIIRQIYKELNEVIIGDNVKSYLKSLNKDGKEFTKIENEDIDAIEQIVEYVYGDFQKSLDKHLKTKCLKESIFNKNIIKCYKFFYDKINHEVDKKIENLNKLKEIFIQTQILEIIVNNEYEGYNIFEILNARGVGLEQHELLKNFIFNYVRPTTITKRQWDYIEENLNLDDQENFKMFLHHYTIMKYRKPATNKEFYLIKGLVTKEKAQDLLDDLVEKSGIYKFICNPEVYKQSNEYIPSIYFSLDFFKRLNIRQVRSLIMSLFSCYERSKISKQTFVDLLIYLENFYFCYILVCKNGPNKIENLIYGYSNSFENYHTIDNLLESFFNELKNYIPQRVDFINDFHKIGFSNKNKNYKNSSDKSLVQYILTKIENYYNHTNELSINQFTIEHIKSDSLNDLQSYKVGNLLPLAEKINENADNLAFKSKIPFYEKSNFLTVKSFLTHYNYWDDDSINKRTDYLAKLAYDNIWQINI